MSQMVDGEGTGDGHSITLFNSEQQVNAQPGPSSPSMSLTDAAPEDTVPVINIDAALESVPAPKQSEPPKIPPGLDIPLGDILVKDKDEQELQGNVFSPSTLETFFREEKFIITLIRTRLEYLENVGSVQHQPKGIEYTQKIEEFIKKRRISSSDEILSNEKDSLFLRQLLEDILDSQMPSLDDMSPDPVLAAVAAAPSCHRRANAELPAPIPYGAEEDV